MPVLGLRGLLVENPEDDSAYGDDNADEGDDPQDLDDRGSLLSSEFGHENNLP